MTPIAVGPGGPDAWTMAQFAIRCHPVAPVAVDELEGWLERQVNELRVEAPNGTIQMSRLTQGPASADLYVGWLVELDLAEGEPLAGQFLADALRDMRLLGLQPTLLAPDGEPLAASPSHNGEAP
jgi:hypothetical protein